MHFCPKSIPQMMRLLAVRFHSQTQSNVPMAGIVVMTPSVLAEECKNFYSEYVLIFPSQPTGMGWFLSLAILPPLPLLFTLHATLFMIKGYHRSRTDSRTCSTNRRAPLSDCLSLFREKNWGSFEMKWQSVCINHRGLRTYLLLFYAPTIQDMKEKNIKSPKAKRRRLSNRGKFPFVVCSVLLFNHSKVSPRTHVSIRFRDPAPFATVPSLYSPQSRNEETTTLGHAMSA